MNLSDADLDGMLKRLHLASARRIWRDMVVRAEQKQWSFRDFLSTLVAEEVAQRQQTRVARLSRRALFPFLKTIDDFDFTFQSTLRLSLLGSALSPDFITEGRSLLLSGKPGRGKTHLAVAIAYRAIQNGFDALYRCVWWLSPFFSCPAGTSTRRQAKRTSRRCAWTTRRSPPITRQRPKPASDGPSSST
jgi:DNA replication protein DnaC